MGFLHGIHSVEVHKMHQAMEIMLKFLEQLWLRTDLARLYLPMISMESTIICVRLCPTCPKAIVLGALPVGFTAMVPMQVADQGQSITMGQFHTANAIACFNGTTKHFHTSVKDMILVVVAYPTDLGSMSRLHMTAQ
jgi:hypothetical protein